MVRHGVLRGPWLSLQCTTPSQSALLHIVKTLYTMSNKTVQNY